MKINIKTTNEFSKVLKEQKRDLDGLMKDAFKEFVKHTPVASGNARRKTKLTNDRIVADYPYAQLLDDGYSDQSPEGMVDPTIEFVEKEFKKIIG